MRSTSRSKKKAVLTFAISLAGAVLAVMELHGWHVYAMLGVLAIVALVAGFSLVRKIKSQTARGSDDGNSHSA